MRRRPEKRPRTWAELRRRVLEEDYFDVSEMKRRRQMAHRMQYAPWLMAVAVALLVANVLLRGFSWQIGVMLALITYGSVASYRLGVRWERRWTELIREKEL